MNATMVRWTSSTYNRSCSNGGPGGHAFGVPFGEGVHELLVGRFDDVLRLRLFGGLR